MPDLAWLDRQLNAGHLPPRFTALALLGEGGGGCVLRADDRLIGRPVAIKVAERSDPGAVAGLVHEVRIAAMLRHPRILPVFDTGITPDGGRWLSMAVGPARSLADILDQVASGGAWPPGLASVNDRLRLILAVCDAVAHAHAMGVVHHDVKPGNILGQHAGEAVLVDWGSATTRAQRDAGQTPRLVTPAYRAPEATADERSDLFALGATLAHLLTGRSPVVDGDGRRLPSLRIALTRPEEERLTRPLRAIIRTALAADPAQRYPSVSAFRDDLQRLVEGLPVSVAPESWPVRLYRQVRRRPITSASLVAAIAAIALAGLLGWRQYRLEHRDWSLIPIAVADPQRWQQIVFPNWDVRRRTELPLDAPQSPWRCEQGVWIGDASSGAGSCANLSLRQAYGRDVRLSWTVTPEQGGLNLNAYLGRDRFDGLTVHVGANGDPLLVFLALGRRQEILHAARLAKPLRSGQGYRMQLSCVDQQLSLAIDGHQILQYPVGQLAEITEHLHAGFEVAKNRIRISDVRLERLPPAQRVHPMAIADALLRRGDAAEALAVLDACTATGEEAGALALRRARCLDRLGQAEAAQTAWSQADIPQARYEQGCALLDQGHFDRALHTWRRLPRSSADLGLMAWRRVCAQAFAEQQLDQCGTVPDDAWEARVAAYVARQRAVIDTLGVAVADLSSQVLPESAYRLVVLAHQRLRPEVIIARLGPIHPGLMARTLYNLGRPGDIVPYPHSPPDIWLDALLAMGRRDEALRLVDDLWDGQRQQLSERTRAWLDQPGGSPADTRAPDWTPIPAWITAPAWVAADPAILTKIIATPTAPTSMIRTAYHLRAALALERGDPAAAVAACDEAQALPLDDHSGVLGIAGLPALVHALAGDRERARDVLRSQLARFPAWYRAKDQAAWADGTGVPAAIGVHALLAGDLATARRILPQQLTDHTPAWRRIIAWWVATQPP